MANIKFTDTLECTATHGKLAKAAQIFDDAQNKTQAAVNVDLYKKIENQISADQIEAVLAPYGLNYKNDVAYSTFNTTEYNYGDVYRVIDGFTWKGKTYDAYSPVKVVQEYSKGNFTENCILPLCAPKNSDASSAFPLQYKGFVSIDDISSQDHKVGDLLIVSDEFDLDGITYGDNTTVLFKKNYTTGNSFDAQEYIVPLSTAKSEVTVDTSALEARITALEAKLKLV